MQCTSGEVSHLVVKLYRFVVVMVTITRNFRDLIEFATNSSFSLNFSEKLVLTS